MLQLNFAQLSIHISPTDFPTHFPNRFPIAPTCFCPIAPTHFPQSSLQCSDVQVFSLFLADAPAIQVGPRWLEGSGNTSSGKTHLEKTCLENLLGELVSGKTCQVGEPVWRENVPGGNNMLEKLVSGKTCWENLSVGKLVRWNSCQLGKQVGRENMPGGSTFQVGKHVRRERERERDRVITSICQLLPY